MNLIGLLIFLQALNVLGLAASQIATSLQNTWWYQYLGIDYHTVSGISTIASSSIRVGSRVRTAGVLSSISVKPGTNGTVISSISAAGHPTVQPLQTSVISSL